MVLIKKENLLGTVENHQISSLSKDARRKLHFTAFLRRQTSALWPKHLETFRLIRRLHLTRSEATFENLLPSQECG